MEWSYRLLDDRERRVFRAVSVFPAGFTLEAAEAVAGPGAGPAVLRLVDCSLLSPPQAGPDGRPRYGMLETLRAYGAGQLAEAGEQERGRGGAGPVRAGGGRAGRRRAAGRHGESAAARWLDAEDATTRQVLAWAMEHDAAVALRLAVALAPWWQLRGRLAGQYPLLRQAAECAEAGSDGWCAAQIWLGWAAQASADLAAALGHFTAVRDAVSDRPPSRALAAALAGRAAVLRHMGRTAEAAGDARRALALAREIGDPVGEVLALIAAQLRRRLRRRPRRGGPAGPAGRADHGRHPWPARPVVQLGADRRAGRGRAPGRSRRVGAAGLARARDAGDLSNQAALLPRIADLDLRAGRTGDAAAHLREGLHVARAGRHLA